MEARVVFPRSALDSVAGAAVMQGNGLQAILDEEANWAKESEYNPFWFFVSLLGPLLLAALFAALYWKYGREPKTGYQGVYERDVPKLSPAVAAALVRLDSQPCDLSATILDLVQRGYLKMRLLKEKKKTMLFFDRETEDYSFEFTSKTTGLATHESVLLREMRAASSNGRLTLSGWKDYASRSRRNFFGEWKKQVLPELTLRKLVNYEGRDKFLLYGGILLATSGLLVLADALALLPLFVGVAVYTICGFALHTALPRRTLEGALAFEKILAFKRFINDYSLLKEKKPQDIILWERYLVYATALGVADKVAKIMDASFTDAQRRQSSFYYAGSFSNAILISSMVNASVLSSAAGSGGYGGGFGGGGG
ncbi:hypothetical protein COY71_00330, partial [Candidatus Micrarchaeota archaeon CG_4_10_14_0_8_um_filter_60_7]